jgi:hypothetical protein
VGSPATTALAQTPPVIGLPDYGGPSTSGTAAVRADLAHQRLRDADGSPLDGRGTMVFGVAVGNSYTLRLPAA